MNIKDLEEAEFFTIEGTVKGVNEKFSFRMTDSKGLVIFENVFGNQEYQVENALEVLYALCKNESVTLKIESLQIKFSDIYSINIIPKKTLPVENVL